MKHISSTELYKRYEHLGKNEVILDVRSKGEFKTEHLDHSLNIPLDQIEQSIKKIKNYEKVYVVCMSGNRSKRCMEFLANHPEINSYSVEGGLNKWKSNNYPTIQGESKNLPIIQQVHITVSILLLIFSMLSFQVSVNYLWAIVFIAIGLLYAGMSGNCMMGILISKMPWNK